MSSRKPPKDSARKAKKLTLNKKTLKDLAPGKAHTADVRGGVGKRTECTLVTTGC